MPKRMIILILILLLCACKEPEVIIDDDQEYEESDIISYNVNYELSYNPIYETGDRFSGLILNRNNTFSMSVNSCDGVDLLTGTFFIEEEEMVLYLVPIDYECNQEEEECDLLGMKFIINSPTEMVIVNGIRCIAEESVFTVEQ